MFVAVARVTGGPFAARVVTIAQGKVAVDLFEVGKVETAGISWGIPEL